jgi:hypothetical protein
MPNNENPTEAHFRAVWTAFIINYGASDKTAKGLQDFLRKATKPADMKLYDFKTQLYQLNKYLPLLPGPHGHCLNDADRFNTIQECVPDWSHSYIASNTTTENINDLLEYYGKLEQQEAKRKPKTCRQDNSKLQQQPARNQNQCHQGTKTNAMEIIATMKSPFAPTISSADMFNRAGKTTNGHSSIPICYEEQNITSWSLALNDMVVKRGDCCGAIRGEKARFL